MLQAGADVVVLGCWGGDVVKPGRPCRNRFCSAWIGPDEDYCQRHTPNVSATPWLLFTPEGDFDGLMWSPKTIEDAQRRFARPQRWTTLAKAGWTVRKGIGDEHVALTDEAIARMRAASP